MRSLRLYLLGLMGPLALGSPAFAELAVEHVTIDAKGKGVPFARHWGDFGADQALVTLDPEYGRQLSKLKRGIPSFEYVRFHNIFSPDLVKVTVKPSGEIDLADPEKVFGAAGDVYANLLSRKLKPYVEIGFMPIPMAKSPGALHSFTYKPNMSEPKHFAEWSRLVGSFTEYLVRRFGADEVRSWPFEIWNEYNLDFFAGPYKEAKVYEGRAFRRKELSYYHLYKSAATAIRSVDPKIAIVGPGTAAVYGLKKFIDWCVDNGAPLPDRISTHVYGNETIERVFGKKHGKGEARDSGAAWVKSGGAVERSPDSAAQYELGSSAMKKARADVLTSKAPWLADRVDFTEFNRSYNKDPESKDPDSTDRASHGPWLLDSYKKTIGVISTIVHWVGTDYRFEELPWELQKDLKDRHGGFGVMDRNGTWKAGGNVMRALGKMPDGERLPDSPHTLVTRGHDGKIAFAAYNTSSVEAMQLVPQIENVEPGSHLRLYRIDDRNANAQRVWEQMGSPKNATPGQVKQLDAAARLTSRVRLVRAKMSVLVPRNGVVVGVIEPPRRAK